MDKIVLLGRPNVGKSTLFNRLIRSNRAITHDRPGITRDRMEGFVRPRDGRAFTIIDTGGVNLDDHAALMDGPEGLRGFEAAILQQAEDAISEASVLCLVVDGRAGLLPFDEHLASHIRKSGKPALVVVNKVDGEEMEDMLTAEFHSLGFPLLAVSASHGFNVRVLEDELLDLLPPENLDAAPEMDVELKMAMLGRPNAGKSSLVNALTGTQRMIVSDIAGTTRDSVDVSFEKDGFKYVFVDTAGVRRRTKITDTVEEYSVNSAIKSTTKAHVTLLVLDALEGVSQQDKRLIDMLNERKTPFIVLLNKIDMVEPKELNALRKDFAEILQFCQHVPLLPVSATTGKGLSSILPTARRLYAECSVRISTGQLNKAMETVLTKHQPPIVRQVRAKFFYLTQAEILPPTFVFFVNDAERVADSYVRYLEKSLRALFDIKHAPMRLRLRSSHKKREK